MFFFSADDNARAEREARRRSRNRAIKRKRAIVRTGVFTISIAALGTSLWILRDMFTAKYKSNRFSSVHHLNHHRRHSNSIGISSINGEQSVVTDETVLSKLRLMPVGSDTVAQKVQSTQDQQTEVEHAKSNNTEWTTGEKGGDSNTAKVGASSKFDSPASKNEEKSQVSKTPDLLPPAVDPSVLEELDGQGQKTNKTNRNEGVENEKATSLNEKENGDTLMKSSEQNLEKEPPGEEEEDVHEDEAFDVIEEEEGGKGPVINLPSKKNKKKTGDEEESSE